MTRRAFLRLAGILAALIAARPLMGFTQAQQSDEFIEFPLWFEPGPPRIGASGMYTCWLPAITSD